MRNIKRLIPFQQSYGGNHYEEAVSNVLRQNGYKCESIFLTPKINNLYFKAVKFFLWIVNSYKVHSSFMEDEICVTPFEGTLFLSSKSKNIVIIHHIDSSYSPFYTSVINWLCSNYLMIFHHLIYKYVVVSQYWKDYLVAKGVKEEKIVVIYNFLNPINLNGMGDKKDFLERHGIKTEKIIYIGNHQKKKGLEVVSKSLASIQDVTLISSGNHTEKCSVSSNTRHLNLSYDDYVRALYFSEFVITFSLFKEGWCRTAHEALLLGKEVLGSGAGGMAELLGTCDIKPITEQNILSETKRILNQNQKNIDTRKLEILTSVERFEDEWLRLVSLEKI